MLKIKYTNKFKKDFKKIKKQGAKIKLFEEIVRLLQEQQALPAKYREHSLKGDYEGFRECHITPDWLLIYEINEKELILVLTRTGSHSDLFS